MIQEFISSVNSFVRGLFNPANYTLHNIVIFVIVLMCIQYIPIESRAGVSPIKVCVMGIMPLVMLTHFRINKALVWGTIYIGWLFFTAGVLHQGSFRASTIMYSAMFMITFIVVYTAVWDYRVFTLSAFTRFIRYLFFVLIGFLLAQQACQLIGVKLFPLINLCYVLDRGIWGNSLTLEPSTLGRLLTVLYYAILKSKEIYDGEKVTIKDVFKEDMKWVTILYIWAILTMGSGTAFVAAGIISLYFMRGWHFLLAIPIFVGIYFTLDYFGNKSFARAQAASIATMSGDPNEIRETDMSASARIAPMLNTINSFDLSNPDFMIGHGCDWSLSPNVRRTNKRILDLIGDYGFIAYLLSLTFVFSCCIQFKSLATVMFFLGVGGGTGNIAYSWGILMVFSAIKYFHDNQCYDYIYEDDDLTE